MQVPKSVMIKESKEDKQELNLAHCHLQAKCQLLKTLNKLKFSCLP